MSNEVTSPDIASATDSMAEQALVDSVILATAKIQDAAAIHTDTADALVRHNSDELAHADIRAEMKMMQGESGFTTEARVNELIDAALANHNVNEEAHEIIRELSRVLGERIAVLEKKVEELTPTDSGDEEDSTLEQQLAAIDAEYDPIIDSIKSAWEAAVMQGKTDTAAELAEQYTKVTEEKALAVQEAMKEYTYA